MIPKAPERTAYCIPVLDCSTQHMTRADGQLLDMLSLGFEFGSSHLDEANWPCMGAYECGGWFFVPDDTDDLETTPWSLELQQFLLKAGEQGWDYVRFDRDSDPIEGVLAFDW